VTLWVLHCHALDAADITPYLNIHSAEKGSGKTRLLEVLRLLVPQPWFTGSVSAAVLFRTIEEKAPTLLLDESDAVFGGDKEYAEALRGVLNTGNDRDGKASRCERQGNNFVSRDYATFCAKAIAGIGDRLPDTVRDRSVPIRLRRKAPDERVERFRRRKVEPELKPLAEQAAAWAFQNTESLRRAEPNLPDELSDRQQDAAEALLAIADAIGAEWSERARAALVELFASAAARDQSIGVQLLAAIRDLFQKAGDPGRLPSAALHEQLIEIEGTPWAEWKDGKPITKNGIAKLLKPYEIYSRCVREGKEVFKGYYMAAFADAWNRYLRADTLYPPSAIVTSLQPAKTQGEMQVCESLQESCVTTEKSEEEPLPERVVTTVTTAKGGIGKKRLTEVEI
jgi:GNAT superfamily N-acetyltransferase